ncbi:MAG: hypothetical protein H7330_00160 [Hymenobacteraceae bacterium]|nr:hypothetical protein [Hymenobacteraceae bacterium]
MKPQELDELFRRGLADQQVPPRPTAWAAIQQRLHAAGPTTDGAAVEDDVLPNFLLGAPMQPAAPVPFMTASRGGDTLAVAPVAAWWQRPALRAAAAVVLLVGGGALALRSGLADADEPEVAVTAATEVQPMSVTPLSLTSEPVSYPKSATSVAVAMPAESESAAPLPTAQAPRAATPERPVMAATVAVTRAATPTPTPAVRHRTTSAHKALDAAVLAAAAPPRAAADSQAVSRRAMVVAGRSAAKMPPSSLTVGEVADATVASTAPSVTASPSHGFVNVRRDDLRVADEDETIEVDGGMVGQFVARATGRPARITSPNALLRRGAGRVRELLDRADHTTDGQLTIETHVAGRAVRKTISL